MSTASVVQLGQTSLAETVAGSTAVVTVAVPAQTFFHKIEGWFKKIFGSANWERTASATLTIVAPLVETIIAVTGDEPAAALVATAVNEIQADLASAAALITQANATPTLVGVLGAVQSNLASLLSEAHIKNPATLQKVTAIVTTISAEVEAIVKVLPTAAATA